MIAPLLALLQQGATSPYAGAGAPPVAPAIEPSARLFRFLFSTVPQWVQIAGVLVGGPVAIMVAWQIWKHRARIRVWLQTRSRAYKAMLAAGIVLMASGVGAAGLYNYNYVMHDNDFCSSCHIMDNAWNRFQVSVHKELSCHTCHRQSMLASSKELFWWVLERRMAVPVHDKVPTAVCSECHMQTATDTSRSNVLLTAGHVLHLKSDSSALAKVECVSCHGRDFHLFRPNNATCSQSGCHMDVRVKLGTMATASFLHCTTCHEFRKRVAVNASEADAKLGVTPGALGCSACHQMSAQVLKWNLAADPHKGSCGSCHNPHTQSEPKAAFKSCATSGCHASADTLTPFHRGVGAHKLDQCGSCHQAHSWKVKGTDCMACHKTIYNDPPAAKRLGGGPPDSIAAFSQAPPQGLAPPAAARDSTFLHSRHRDITCTECHGTGGTHGAIKVTAPRDCQACHHSVKQASPCSACHAATALQPRAHAVTFRVAARTAAPVVTRPVPFAHATHTTIVCARCHGPDDTRRPTATCNDCHADHHEASRDCAACHTAARAGHDRTVHDGCTSCHTAARSPAAAAMMSRNGCLACHQEQKLHYPTGSCATCHAIPHRPETPRERRQ